MELTRFQKLLLAVLAGMLLVFSVLMAWFRAHPGVAFEGGLLKITEHADQTVYSGRAHGTPVAITAARAPEGGALTTVEFTIGSEIHDVCQVEYPLVPIQTEHGDTVNGIRVTKNGALLFAGGYDPEWAGGMGWYGKDGAWKPMAGAGATISGAGQDPWRNYETTAAEAVRFALGPEAAARGDPLQFAAAVMGTLFLAIGIVFHRQLFRWRHWGARDPEPLEGYLAFERVGWVIAAVIIAVLYLGAMTEIC